MCIKKTVRWSSGIWVPFLHPGCGPHTCRYIVSAIPRSQTWQTTVVTWVLDIVAPSLPPQPVSKDPLCSISGPKQSISSSHCLAHIFHSYGFLKDAPRRRLYSNTEAVLTCMINCNAPFLPFSTMNWVPPLDRFLPHWQAQKLALNLNSVGTRTRCYGHFIQTYQFHGTYPPCRRTILLYGATQIPRARKAKLR